MPRRMSDDHAVLLMMRITSERSDGIARRTLSCVRRYRNAGARHCSQQWGTSETCKSVCVGTSETCKSVCVFQSGNTMGVKEACSAAWNSIRVIKQVKPDALLFYLLSAQKANFKKIICTFARFNPKTRYRAFGT